MNGANEAAVEAFLSGTILWSEIAPSIERALELHDGATADSVDAIVRAARRGRECVRSKSAHGGSGV